MSVAHKLPNNENSQSIEPKKFSTAQATDFKPANPNKRVIAFIIDGIILTVIRLGALALTKNIYLGYVLSLVYMIALPMFRGATLGKKAMGLRIVTKDNQLNLSLGSLLMREIIGRVISIVPLGLGYIWCRINKEGKTWHDMIGGTKVVEYR